MDQFVSVRIVQANALDLGQFQFDFDLTFAVQFLNADGTVYGRFGSRSEREDAEKDITLEGFRQALEGALVLHRQYPDNRKYLAGKQPQPLEFARPEQYPSLARYGPKIDYEGQAARSCMHCHQIRDARRQLARESGEPMSDKLLYPWPMPDVAGLELDPRRAAKVESVAEGSPAAKAGFEPGDELAQLAGQALLSIADVQWVLHHTPDEGELPAVIRRDGQLQALALTLPEGWRRQSDLSWRVSTWSLRRMALGGLVLERLPEEERQRRDLAADAMALRIKHVGQYGDHAVAKRNGFRKDDVIVTFAGRDDLSTETEVIAHAMKSTKPSERVKVGVLRGDRRMELTLPVQ